MKPCDLYDGKDYAWGALYVPNADFERKLEMAPRFEFDHYVLEDKRKNPCDFLKGDSSVVERTLRDTLWQYDVLYGEKPDETWWGNDFYNVRNDETRVAGEDV